MKIEGFKYIITGMMFQVLILSRNYIILFYDNFLMGLFIMGIGISRTMGCFSLVQKESGKAKANIGDTQYE